jgi:SM-20-related protein
MSLRYLDMAAFRATPRASEPFEYLVVPGVRAPGRLRAHQRGLSEDFRTRNAQLSFGSAFQEFLDELESDEFRRRL